MKVRTIAWTVGMFFATAAHGATLPASDMERRMEAVNSVVYALTPEEDPTPPVRAAFSANFSDLSKPEVEGLSSEDLRFYLTAASLVVFFSNSSEDLARLEHGFLVLESRGDLQPLDFEMMFKAYIKLREFEAAESLARRHPQMEHERLTAFRGGTQTVKGPSVLRLEPDGGISRVPAGLATEGPQVVVAAHPLCHFSNNAIRAIEGDGLLASMFGGRTLWLMPQDSYLNIDVVTDWNRDHPDYEMRWAYATSDWPMIKRWATPNFYFYLDGELVETVIGWPPEGQRDALLAAFAKIGMVPPASGHP